MAEEAQRRLGAAGFGVFQVADTQVAGRAATLLQCARPDAGRAWAVREYIVVHGDVGFCVGCGSSAPEDDDPMFAVIAERTELLEPGQPAR